MPNRRDFLKIAAITGGINILREGKVYSAQSGVLPQYFSVHPEIEKNPDAVFIMKTHVDDKMNSDAKLQTGREFARSVFVLSDKPGISLTTKIAVKPNSILGKAESPYPPDYLMGAHVDPSFLEGVIEEMKNLGLKGNQFYIRDTSNDDKTFEESGYLDMVRRVGADIAGRVTAPETSPERIQWVDVHKGIIHRRIPYLWPFNAPDTFLLNIAKFKSHAMGLTLCSKNVQGMIAYPYQAFCGGFQGPLRDCKAKNINQKYMKVVESNFRRHLADGIPRWDKPGTDYRCGLGMETWVTRTLDNVSATRMGLCIVEGIYGRDGSHFDGPHPPYKDGVEYSGRTHDFMTNIIFFGKNPFHVDIIGHWLGGHEPGNFGLFHLARERKMSKFLDPRKIPLFQWENGKAVSAKLDDFDRTELLTPYLRRNYNGQEEPVYHLCNERYEYRD
ncbi:MAG: DUF362 domain-containing protein [Candidatus Latescibacterota bacterium]